MYKRKNVGTKSHELTNLKLLERLFVSKSMSHENQQLPYKINNPRVPDRSILPGSSTMLHSVN